MTPATTPRRTPEVQRSGPSTTLTPRPPISGPSTEIWLYGSVARGSHHPGSDLDVLTVGNWAPDPELLRTITMQQPQQQHLSVRHYTWDQLIGMARYGSLYLLHLKLEGRRLHPANGQSVVADILTGLPPYQLADRDLAGFTQALDDVEWSLTNEPDVAFELGVLATILRHCSILACYLTARPLFDCALSIPHAFAAVGMEHHAQDAVNLYQFRLLNSRGTPPTQEPSPALAAQWLSTTRTFVHKVKAL